MAQPAPQTPVNANPSKWQAPTRSMQRFSLHRSAIRKNISSSNPGGADLFGTSATTAQSALPISPAVPSLTLNFALATQDNVTPQGDMNGAPVVRVPWSLKTKQKTNTASTFNAPKAVNDVGASSNSQSSNAVETSSANQVLSVPEVTSAYETSNAPQASNNPQAFNAFGTSNNPQVFNTFENSISSQVFNPPKASNNPQAFNAPEAPKAVQALGNGKVPSTLGVRRTPEIARMSVWGGFGSGDHALQQLRAEQAKNSALTNRITFLQNENKRVRYERNEARGEDEKKAVKIKELQQSSKKWEDDYNAMKSKFRQKEQEIQERPGQTAADIMADFFSRSWIHIRGFLLESISTIWSSLTALLIALFQVTMKAIFSVLGLVWEPTKMCLVSTQQSVVRSLISLKDSAKMSLVASAKSVRVFMVSIGKSLVSSLCYTVTDVVPRAIESLLHRTLSLASAVATIIMASAHFLRSTISSFTRSLFISVTRSVIISAQFAHSLVSSIIRSVIHSAHFTLSLISAIIRSVKLSACFVLFVVSSIIGSIVLTAQLVLKMVFSVPAALLYAFLTVCYTVGEFLEEQAKIGRTFKSSFEKRTIQSFSWMQLLANLFVIHVIFWITFCSVARIEPGLCNLAAGTSTIIQPIVNNTPHTVLTTTFLPTWSNPQDQELLDFQTYCPAFGHHFGTLQDCFYKYDAALVTVGHSHVSDKPILEEIANHELKVRNKASKAATSTRRAIFKAARTSLGRLAFGAGLGGVGVMVLCGLTGCLAY